MRRLVMTQSGARSLWAVGLILFFTRSGFAQEAPTPFFYTSGPKSLAGCNITLTLPATGPVVIETVSLFAGVGPTEVARARVALYNPLVGGGLATVANYWVPLLRQGSMGNRAIWQALYPLKIPVSGDQTLTVLFLRDDCAADNAAVSITFSGYQVTSRQ